MGMVMGRIDVEMPTFEKLDERSGFEVRKYHPRMAISTMAGDDSTGFRTLASYIGVFSAPQNEKQEPIAMTAPVVTTTKGEMQFVLPSAYSAAGAAPQPSAKGVTLVERAPTVMAVKTFSGLWSNFEPMRDELIAAIEKDGYKVQEPLNWEVYRYNGPMTLPFMRTNEVAVELDLEGSTPTPAPTSD